jgi:hypothetical protein
MELETRQFGCVGYEPQDVIELVSVEPEGPVASSWLLLADKLHPHLYWLQSTTDAVEAMPVCSLAGAGCAGRLRVTTARVALTRETAAEPPAMQNFESQPRGRCLALAEICGEGDEAFLDLERPILIDPRSRRAIRVHADDVQALQHAPSAKALPLRKCA